ncbi:MAG: Crp/Fnr family transcriptional regulator [Candidatus Riflebacteria bacterium]|nr:Crp/Fnr family transcriptional regulator [Candidatus Riflebacteria bacterium]
MRYLTKGREITVKAGSLVYRTGDPIHDDAIYYIISGSVKLIRKMRDDYEFCYLCGTDDSFGVTTAMSDTKRECDAVALEDCQLYAWSKDAFESAVSLYIEFARLAIQHLSRYMREVNRELAKAGRF